MLDGAQNLVTFVEWNEIRISGEQCGHSGLETCSNGLLSIQQRRTYADIVYCGNILFQEAHVQKLLVEKASKKLLRHN